MTKTRLTVEIENDIIQGRIWTAQVLGDATNWACKLFALHILVAIRDLPQYLDWKL